MSAPATARIEVIVKHDDASADPEDLASRNAKGETAADRGGDVARVAESATEEPDAEEPNDPEGDDADEPDDDDEEAEGFYDEDGELTETGHARVMASSFAVPEKKHLPIHDKRSTRGAMRDFGGYSFKDAGQRHAAFNRIRDKAMQFGLKTGGFDSKYAGKLDRAPSANKDSDMTEAEIKALQAKADERKEKLKAAKARVDALETERDELKRKLDAAEVEIENSKRASKPAEPVAKTDADEVAQRAQAKVELLDKARATGAKVDAKMSEPEIMRAVIKHVDGDDVPADKSGDFVAGVFEGALKRAKKDQADTEAGATALAGARQVINANSAPHRDADDTDEDAAKARLRRANADLLRSGKETK